jgi:hypothetical protein
MSDPIISTFTLIQNSKNFPPFIILISITIFHFAFQIYFPLSFLSHYFVLCIFSFINISYLLSFLLILQKEEPKLNEIYIFFDKGMNIMITKLTFLVHISSSLFLCFISLFLRFSVRNTQRKINCCTRVNYKDA